MRRSDAEYIRSLELRIAQLERHGAPRSRRESFLEVWNEKADLKMLFNIISSKLEKGGYEAIPMKLKGKDLYTGILIKGISKSTFESPDRNIQRMNERDLVAYRTGGGNWLFTQHDWPAGLWLSFAGPY